MKNLIVLLVASILVSVAAMSVIASEKGPAEITLPAKMGDVSFNHAAHQERVADCTTCHHNGTEAGKCSSCHGVDKAAPKLKKAFHDTCKSCHKKQGGPTKCKECHQK